MTLDLRTTIKLYDRRQTVEIVLPYWMLTLAGVPLPLLAMLRWRRRRIKGRRITLGQCLNCGYDLRHSSNRCPECGLIKA